MSRNYIIFGLGHRCVQIVEQRSLPARGTGKMPILLDATMTVALYSMMRYDKRLSSINPLSIFFIKFELYFFQGIGIKCLL